MTIRSVYSQLAPASFVFRLCVVLAVLSFERVVGLPVLGIGLAMQWSELLGERDKVSMVVGSGVLLAVVYQLPFSLSIALYAAGLLGAPLLIQHRRFVTPWVFGVVLALTLVVWWWGQIPFSTGVLAAGCVSFAVLFVTRQWTSRWRSSSTWF